MDVIVTTPGVLGAEHPFPAGQTPRWHLGDPGDGVGRGSGGWGRQVGTVGTPRGGRGRDGWRGWRDGGGWRQRWGGTTEWDKGGLCPVTRPRSRTATSITQPSNSGRACCPCHLQSNMSASLSPLEQHLCVQPPPEQNFCVTSPLCPSSSRQHLCVPVTSRTICLCPRHLQSNTSVSPSPPEQYLCLSPPGTSVSPALTISSPHETQVKASGCTSPAQEPAAGGQQCDPQTSCIEQRVLQRKKKNPHNKKQNRVNKPVPSHLEGRYWFISICWFIFRRGKTQKPAQKM